MEKRNKIKNNNKKMLKCSWCQSVYERLKEYRQIWHREALLQPFVHHGEKFNQNLIVSNTAMDKQDSLEMEMINCVNPYYVMGTSAIAISTDDSQHQDITVTKKVLESSNGLDCLVRTQTRNKLPMEEFRDLSQFVATTSSDELNTPVLDKEAFSYTSPATNNNNYDGILNNNNFIEDGLLNEYDIYENIINIPTCHNNYTTTTTNDISVNFKVNNQEHQQNQESLVFSDISNDSDLNVPKCISPQNQQQEEAVAISSYNSPIMLNDPESPEEQTIIPFYSNSALSVNDTTTEHFSNVSSQNGLITPEDSNGSCPPPDLLQESKKNLNLKMFKLNVNLKPNNEDFILNTPDVIESVVNLEEDNYNLYHQLFQNKDLTTINAEDIFPVLQPASQNLPYQPLLIKQEHDEQPTCSKRIRKRKNFDDDEEWILEQHEKEDDDDVDYIPPIKIKNTTRYNESSDEDEVKYNRSPKPAARGRKSSKRTLSISSEGSNDVSKYRELRDKNNEASKKSRLKRKIKEMELEKELTELQEKNIKLKARVTEMQKMVDNFRNDFLKTIVKK